MRAAIDSRHMEVFQLEPLPNERIPNQEAAYGSGGRTVHRKFQYPGKRSLSLKLGRQPTPVFLHASLGIYHRSMLYTCHSLAPAYYMENSSGTNRVNCLSVRVKRLAACTRTPCIQGLEHVGLCRVGNDRRFQGALVLN